MKTKEKFISNSINGNRIAVFEDRSLVELFRNIDFSAYCLGADEDIPEEDHQYFKGARILIFTKLKDSGYTQWIVNKLSPLAYSISVIKTDSDLKSYIQNQGTMNQIVEGQSPVYYAPWVYLDGNKQTERINADVMAKTLSNQMHFFRQRIPCEEREPIYFYQNGVYSIVSKTDFKALIKGYIPVGMATDKLLNEVYNLMLSSNTNSYSADEINSDENIINLKNGLYFVDKQEFMPHSKDILSTTQLNCKYDKSAPTPKVFLRVLDDICTDENGLINRDMQAVFQEIFGLYLSNISVCKTKRCPVLYSPMGNTGKTQLLNVLTDIIGIHNTINIPIQDLSARFAGGNFYGKRIINVGDQKSGDIEDCSIFKQITGGDSLNAEPKGKQSFSFKFSGGMIISCNDLPKFVDDKGEHLFKRLLIIPLTNVIPEGKRDPELLSKMLAERNGIFMWGLQGLHRLIGNNYNFTSCQACEDIMTQYRGESDTLFAFLNANYIITGNKQDRVKKLDLYNQYVAWCTKTERTSLSRTSTYKRAEKNGLGQTMYCGYSCFSGLKEKHEGFIDITGTEEEIPFTE